MTSADTAVVAYAGAAKGRSYEAWREEFCRRFCQLDAEPGSAERIDCTVEVARVGALSFGSAHGESCSFMRTRPLLNDGCDDLVLVTAAAGEVLTIQRGRATELKTSQMSLMALDDIAECALGAVGRFTALRIPRRDLLSVYAESEDKLSKPLVASTRLGDIVADYFSLCASAGVSLDAVGQQTMARQMTELVGLLLRGDEAARPSTLYEGYDAARLRLIQAQALDRLNDSGLTIVSAARRAGVTPKKVQRLFEPTGTTFSEFVLEQRLLLAHRLLSGPSNRHKKIGSVAQDAGFGDLSYFNRTFRKRFGMTPSEWRDAQPTYS